MRRAPGNAVGVLAVSLFILVAAASATAATQIGQTFSPEGFGLGDQTHAQIASPGAQYAAPFDGVVTSWSFQASNAASQIKLKIARPVGPNTFTVTGESSLKTPTLNQLNTYSEGIPMQTGDVLGLFVTSSSVFFRNAPGYATSGESGDVLPGATGGSDSTAFQLDVSATLEPDCDNDGFGDETQDTDLSPCPPAPETTITRGPKDKTKKKTATFEFTANEPGATFECSLDGKPFAACSSPDTLKVKKGKHSFAVRAADAGGNVDGSPASDGWKVKKKKRHK